MNKQHNKLIKTLDVSEVSRQTRTGQSNSLRILTRFILLQLALSLLFLNAPLWAFEGSGIVLKF